MKKELLIPKNIEQVISFLDLNLNDDDKSFLIENGALSVHQSLGRWMRNNWGLWEDSELKQFLLNEGIEHPDEMSNYLIEEYITHLKAK